MGKKEPAEGGEGRERRDVPDVLGERMSLLGSDGEGERMSLLGRDGEGERMSLLGREGEGERMSLFC